MNIKTFYAFKSPGWIGPLKVIDIKKSIICTSVGNFKNKNKFDIKIGYTYIFKILGDKIIDFGMSCVDIIVLVRNRMEYKLLSIKRKNDPFINMWANPGGNIDEDEIPIRAAVRELREETGLNLNIDDFHYVDLYDQEGRDPRNKNCISYAFCVVLDEIPEVTAGDDAKEYTWNRVNVFGNTQVKLAFDHNYMVRDAVKIIQL